MEFDNGKNKKAASYNIRIDDLERLNDSHSEHPELLSATLQLPGAAFASEIWDRLEELGFVPPLIIVSSQGHELFKNDVREILNPFTEVDIVATDVPSSYDEKRININDSFVSFANLPYESRSELSVELQSSDSSPSTSGSDTVVISNNFEITFQRTLRMPDDNRLHQLPASLGQFSLFNVEEYAERLPPNIIEKAGLFFPMWQREAMWMNFSVRTEELSSKYTNTYALRIYVGEINAVSGLPRNEKPPMISDQKMKQDYVVAPLQKWIDGICIAPGVVRQFVAMPLGGGYTIEGQKRGQERFGGLQIEIIPRYISGLKIWCRASDPQPTSSSCLGSLDEYTTPAANNLKVGEKVRVHPVPPTKNVPKTISDLVADFSSLETHFKATHYSRSIAFDWHLDGLHPLEPHGRAATRRKSHAAPSKRCRRGGIAASKRRQQTVNVEATNLQATNLQATNLQAMGLAAGGKLIQDILKDPNTVQCWNTKQSRLINIHILDPKSCEQVTHVVPQPPPINAKAYTDAGLPFYVMQEDVDNRVEKGDFEGIKSVSAMDQEVGISTEEEFDPMKPRMCITCEKRLCDCIIRPCNHTFCNTCISSLPASEPPASMNCPRCSATIDHVAGFSAPMNLPGEERLKMDVPVRLLQVNHDDGGVELRSSYRTRI